MQIPFPEGDRFLTPDSDTEIAPATEGVNVQRSLQSVLIRALGIFGLLPVLVLGLGAGVWDYRVRLQQAEVALQAAATSASADLELFLQAHRSAVVQVSSLLRDQTPGTWTEPSIIDVLERTRAAFPALLTMLVTDADGRIIAGSFDDRTGIGRQQWHQTDVSDRNYFRRPRDTGEPAISDVFIGRGFGTDPLCALSAPVLDAGSRFAGVVQGAIRLDALSRAFAAARHHPGLELVILDPAGKVAFASAGLGLDVLAIAPQGLLRDVPVGVPEFRSPMIPALPSGDSLVFENITGLGWRVVTLMPRRVLLERTLLDLWVVAIALLVVAATALWAGRRYGTLLVRPIEQIGARMDHLALSAHPERFQVRSRLHELARLEASFLRLGQRLGDSYAQLQAEFAKESALREDLAAARVESQRAEVELEAAREIQMAMLPSSGQLARLGERIDIAALLEPMRAVGGDFFNVLPVDAQRLSFFIGDVSDKGVPAALFMARTMTLLEPAVTRGESPAQILARVGRTLARDNPGGMFVTVLIGQIDLDSGAVSLSSAGHDPPVLRRAGGQIEPLELATGPALGFEEDAEYPCLELQLGVGDTLLLYTDGVTEAEDSTALAFGELRLGEALLQVTPLSAQNCIDALMHAVAQHREGPPADDLTVLCLHRPAGAGNQVGSLGLRPEQGAGALLALLDELDDALARRGVGATAREDAHLVAEEWVSNALNHGSAQQAIAVKIHFEVQAERLLLEFEDDGTAFDPLAQNLPDIDAPIEDRRIGGLGVLLVRQLSRDLRYRRSEGYNLLSLWLPRVGLGE
jgi:serine phosphatase RsbU (regulator of sigma subunit)/anti-sigma regulatory factor (Ser/Thr protein kinase)